VKVLCFNTFVIQACLNDNARDFYCNELCWFSSLTKLSISAFDIIDSDDDVGVCQYLYIWMLSCACLLVMLVMQVDSDHLENPQRSIGSCSSLNICLYSWQRFLRFGFELSSKCRIIEFISSYGRTANSSKGISKGTWCMAIPYRYGYLFRTKAKRKTCTNLIVSSSRMHIHVTP
jgi:hypothetical protein